MKVGMISDIHVNINKDYGILETLADRARGRQIDLLVVAGDISNHYSTTAAGMDRLQAMCGMPVYFVPGNHDLWDEQAEIKDTGATYARYQAHPSCLIGKSVDLGNGWALVGETGWYDYSFGGAQYTADDFLCRKLGERTWMDSVNADWRQKDVAVNRRMLQALESRLIENRGKRVIAVTHMVTDKHFTVPDGTDEWSYFNAFLGSQAYGKLFAAHNVAYSVFGHVHYRKSLTIGHTQYICPCLNYHTQWRTRDVAMEVDEAMTVVELAADGREGKTGR